MASQAEIAALKDGDLVTVVYWDDANKQNTTGSFKILKNNNGIATLDDPNLIINHGDSGGGVYYNGKLIGNVWSIHTDEADNPIGKFDVALLPPGVK